MSKKVSLLLAFKKEGDPGWKSEEQLKDELADWVAGLLSKDDRNEVRQTASGPGAGVEGKVMPYQNYQ